MKASYPTSVWDGTTPTRDDPEAIRAPDWQDYLRLREEIKAIQTQMKPLWIGVTGAFRTSPGAGVNEVQTLEQIAALSGNWKLTFTIPGSAAVTTANLAYNISAANLETAIDVAATAASVVGWTNGDISCSGGPINVDDIVLTFDGISVKKQNIAICSTTDVSLSSGTSPTVTETVKGVVPVNEIQTLGQIASISGSWELTFTVPSNPAVTTAPLAYNISAANLETAIDVAATAALIPGWTNGDISCSVGPINANNIILTFDGDSVAAQDIVDCVTADIDLSDGTPPTVTETTKGVTSVNEVQTLGQITATSGNWKLTFTVPGSAAVTTANLAYNISAAALETAINVAATAASVGGWTNGDISVSGGPINAGNIILTFDGVSVAALDISACSTTDISLNDPEVPPVVSTTAQGVSPTVDPTTTLYKAAGNAVKVG